MAFNTTGFTTGLFGLLKTTFFWVILIVVFVFVAVTFLWIRKNKKIKVKGIEVLDIGRDKCNFSIGRANNGGWFKHHTTFFGLWDYGAEEVFKLRDGRQVQGVSAKDFHELNGTMCLVYARSPEDPRILVPLSRIKTVNGELLTKIANVDLRSTAVDIIKKAEKETSDKMDKVLQYVFWGAIIIFSFIAIILVVNFGKSSVSDAGAIIKSADSISQDKLALYCEGLKTKGEVVASSTAP